MTETWNFIFWYFDFPNWIFPNRIFQTVILLNCISSKLHFSILFQNVFLKCVRLMYGLSFFLQAKSKSRSPKNLAINFDWIYIELLFWLRKWALSWREDIWVYCRQYPWNSRTFPRNKPSEKQIRKWRQFKGTVFWNECLVIYSRLWSQEQISFKNNPSQTSFVQYSLHI